jgi:hypothetical protein
MKLLPPYSDIGVLWGSLRHDMVMALWKAGRAEMRAT